jgi:predicted MFS family arabinose efflux permease
LLALLNALLLSWLFKETFTLKPRQAIKLHRAIEVLISGFREEKVRSLSVILLIMLFGWSSFYSFVSSFLLHEYKFSVLHISLFMAALSVGFGIGTGFVVDPLAKRFSLKGSIVVNLFICAFAIAVMVLSGHVLYAWVCIIPIGACIATAYAMLLTLFSNQVATEHQGWVMGITSSILAFAFGINGVLTGLISIIAACAIDWLPDVNPAAIRPMINNVKLPTLTPIADNKKPNAPPTKQISSDFLRPI